ncbi:hypothetical protein CONPUDRAFT_135678 [Coniophora puteana RWD-64-598 SS2]|uniref:Uncharacterized protein n=1 Tax=Coniophora puteana (strain RWD-64-598) TaxID=741705 RepID=A0A5M3MZP7_CONPW|nr:uncharacterized protein CONPUDRAFT_135678 [Coniophora puteana RWD-64-598 SS2]EIW84115.1 hypothetical protein CONPUDRAFT_135678 [Coniophora puteana RWD-64-598 SS2]
MNSSVQDDSGVFRTLVAPVIIPYYIMAVLAQKSSPLLLRLPLLCVVILSAFRAAINLDMSSNNIRHQYLNHGLALAMFVLSMRCTIWTFQRTPCTRVHRKKADHPSAKQTKDDIHSALWDAFDLMVNLRGIGWNWDSRRKELRLLQSTTESASLFAFKALLRFLCLAVLFDIIVAFINSLAPHRNFSPGTTIFDVSYPPMLRYLRASLLTIVAGWTVVIIIALLYEMQTFINVLFIRQDPYGPRCFTHPGSRHRWHRFGAKGGISFLDTSSSSLVLAL